MTTEKFRSQFYIKHNISFNSEEGISSSEDIESARKKERKEFEERKRKRKEADPERLKRIAFYEKKRKRDAQKRLDEERGRQLYKQQYKATMAVLDDDFINARRIIEDINADWLINFETIKAEWICKNVKSLNLSDSQLLAIGDVSHNCLLRARAGSGKTTVLKQKLDLLLRKTAIQPDEILVLAFNNPTAEDIRREVQEDLNHMTFSTSLTFHSLAHRIINPEKKVLHGEELSRHIESLLRKEINPSVRADIYEFFRREMAEMENLGSLLNKSDYYEMRRASTIQTLKNDQVKSKGEKWIADFLFEHDISYVYERSWTVDAKNKGAPYRPDFSIAINGKIPNVIVEHWGIDEFDSNREVPKHWSNSWDEYYSSMEWKRNYWREHNINKPDKVIFIETSIRDTRNGREAFEAILKRKLSDEHVTLIKLPKEELEQKVVRKQIPKLAKSIETFIGKAKKACIAPSELEAKLVAFDFKSEKEKIFAKLAARIFRRYQDLLSEKNRLDFDDVMSQAEKKIRESKGKISIMKRDKSFMSLEKIKWIMIDEYQDFSQLFYNMVDSMRYYNPELKLFCVGDNWQAINGFAGSNLKFFDNFLDYFKEATVLDLPENYRSQSNIVDQANAFMKGKGGVPSVTKNHDLVCLPVYKFHVNEVYINYDNRDTQKIHEVYKTRALKDGEMRNLDVSFEMARLFMLCESIMREHPLDTTDFMILSRTSSLGYAYNNLEKFKTKLREIFKPDLHQFKNFDEQVLCKTAHSSKGLEADVVLVLHADKRKFPLMHPDNLLNRILGVSIDEVYREEERLFYVAITRAKQNLYFTTEKGRESEFLRKVESELRVLPRNIVPQDWRENLKRNGDV